MRRRHERRVHVVQLDGPSINRVDEHIDVQAVALWCFRQDCGLRFNLGLTLVGVGQRLREKCGRTVAAVSGCTTRCVQASLAPGPPIGVT